MPILTPIQEFYMIRSHDLSAANPDPFRYGACMSDFLREIADATAQMVAEVATSPLEVVNFSNRFYARLAAAQGGIEPDARLTPLRLDIEPMPSPEEIPAYVEKLMARHTLPPAPVTMPTENLPLPLEQPAAAVAPKAPKVLTYKRRNTRGPAVGADYLSGAELFALRKERDLTQDELAELSGVSAGHISNLETGRAQGLRKHYRALRKALNLPVEEATHE